MNFQQLILALQSFWAQQGCIVAQPYDVEKGAGTGNPHTFLRSLGPEPWNVAYVEPCRRPTDGRYGENPNRLGAYYQFQVILKPSPKNVMDLYLRSLSALGIKPKEHDIRFVEDDWEQPTLGAWGLGWEVWLDGMEITQFTYFQQVGGIECRPVCAELTYGIERIATYLQGVDSIFDIDWGGGFSYREVHQQTEVEWSKYNFEHADPTVLFELFKHHYAEAVRLADLGLVYPSYDNALKCSHVFNTLDARGAISVSERAAYIGRIRNLARLSAKTFVQEREKLGFPILARAGAPLYDDDDDDDIAETATMDAALGEKPVDEPAELLLELGCEEIPARFLDGAAASLSDQVVALLDGHNIGHGEARAFWTPRRLCVTVHAVEPKSATNEELVKGPPARISFDADGAPRVPATKFAQGQGVTVDELETVTTDKGDYVAVRRTTGGIPSALLLARDLPDVIAAIPWPKSMRWGSREERFVRPLHWIVALLGGVQLRFEWAEVRSGNLTTGHRFFGSEIFPVWSYETLRDGLSARHVILEPAERSRIIEGQLIQEAGELGGEPVMDRALLRQVTGLVEAPRVVAGTFDPDFLRLPREVIETILTHHQKMFAVVGSDGKLLPAFLGVSNNPEVHQPATRTGYEKVAVARLQDGVFFYENDRKLSLEEHGAELERITFLQGAGTIGDKVRRLVNLIDVLGQFVDETAMPDARRAALLCKSDLSTAMVGEFPELQGTIGRIYARLDGEPMMVSEAVFEHYLPRGADDLLPITIPGALVALVDKIDTLAACFALGKIPTGSADPFALRRAALGILRILMARDVHLPISLLVGSAVSGVSDFLKGDRHAVASQLMGFLRTRLKGLWTSAGHATDLAEAVLEAGFDDVADGHSRLEALSALRGSEAFRALIVSFKRIANILRKASAQVEQVDLDEGLLEDGAERDLHDAFVALRSTVDDAIHHEDHATALTAMVQLRQPLATFFDDVLVMAEDERVRANRIALLTRISEAFGRIADFAAISTD